MLCAACLDCTPCVFVFFVLFFLSCIIDSSLAYSHFVSSAFPLQHEASV